MPWLRLKLGSGHYTLHMRQMHAAYRKESTVEQGKIRGPVNPPGNVIKKNPTHGAWRGPSMRQCMNYKAHDMLKRARKHKRGGYKKHSGQMARRWQIPQVFVRYWVDWGTDLSIWCNRIGRFLRGYMARKKSEREIMEHFFECRRYSWVIESAQWLWRSEAQMQKTVWRTQQSLDMETNLSHLGNKSGNGSTNNFQGPRTITVQDGDTILLPGRRIHLRYHTGDQAATGSQLGTGIRGKHHPGLNSNFILS